MNEFGESYQKLPSQAAIYPYLLLALHYLGGSAHGKVVMPKVAELMALPEDAKGEKFAGGKFKFEIYVQFAMSVLRQAGFLKSHQETQGRGFWEVNEQGEQQIKILLESQRVPQAFDDFRKSTKKRAKHIEKRPPKADPSDDLPEANELQDEVAKKNDLKEITQMDPYAFERLAISLLRKMGFHMEGTPKSRDHGIDGIGYVRVGLISFKTVMQAKRYAEDNIVGESAMQNFLGAQTNAGAEKGIFITTSEFSKPAKDLAVKHSITLINGEELIDLMQKEQIGYGFKLNLAAFGVILCSSSAEAQK